MPTYFEKYGHTVITVITVAAIIAAFVGLVTIDGNRFDSQDRRLDAQDRLISQHFEGVNQRLDGHDTLINRHFEAVDRQFEAVNQRLDRLTDEVSELRRLMVGISERVSRNEGEIDVIREQLRIADTPSP